MSTSRASIALLITGVVALGTASVATASTAATTASTPASAYAAVSDMGQSAGERLAHVTVGIDPGHNGDNYKHPP